MCRNCQISKTLSLPVTPLIEALKDWNYSCLKIRSWLAFPKFKHPTAVKMPSKSSADSASFAVFLLTSIRLLLPRCSTSAAR